VFVWHCGTNIGSVVNVPEVVEAAKTMPLVAYAGENKYTCSEIDNIGYELTAPMFPLIKDFKACGDAFEDFKDYARAMMVADKRAGLHEVEVIEDSPSIFAYDVKYCIWNEVAKEFGVSQLCYAGRCYGDEVFFNTVLPKVGAVYKRTGTLTLGAPVCDVRFELRTQENK
jgi:hypothetical protein